LFFPGSKFKYSNTNYILLGFIIEDICGKTYSECLIERITGRLGLKKTAVMSNNKDIEPENSNYCAFLKTFPRFQTHASVVLGAGALISSPKDMIVFINSLFTGKLIKAENLLKMAKMEDDYGHGMMNGKKILDCLAYGHLGTVDQFTSCLFYIPTNGLSVAYSSFGFPGPEHDEKYLRRIFHECKQF